MFNFSDPLESIKENPKNEAAIAAYISTRLQANKFIEMGYVGASNSSIQLLLSRAKPSQLKIYGYPVDFLYRCLFHGMVRDSEWEKFILFDNRMLWYPEHNTVGIEVICYSEVAPILEVVYFTEEDNREMVIHLPWKEKYEFKDLDTDEPEVLQIMQQELGLDSAITTLVSVKTHSSSGALTERSRHIILAAFEDEDWLGADRWRSLDPKEREDFVSVNEIENAVELVAKSQDLLKQDDKRGKLVKRANKIFFRGAKKRYTEPKKVWLPRDLPLEVLRPWKLLTKKGHQRSVREVMQDRIDAYLEGVATGRIYVQLHEDGTVSLVTDSDHYLMDIGDFMAAKALKLKTSRVSVAIPDEPGGIKYYPLPPLSTLSL